MSKLIKSTFSTIFKGADLLVRGHILKSKEGAEFLNNKKASEFLNSWNTGLLLDGESKRLSEQESFQNACLVARVGAGKTTKYVIPNVLNRANKKCSVIVHDPKGEVFQLTAGYMKSKGFNIVLFNPKDVTQSNYFNPFSEAKDEIELEQIAETIIWSGNPEHGDAYWNNGATRILSVLIKCLSFGDKDFFNLPNLHHLLQGFGAMGEGLDDWIAGNCWNPLYPDDRYILEEWKGALTGNKEAIQSFVGICLTALKSLTNRSLRQFFSKSDYNLERFRKEKTVIYFVTPPEAQKYYSFVTSLFFRSVFNECMRPHHLQGKTLPAYILYDEFGNSFVSDFVSVANTIRGYKVSLSIILQSISQLEDKYGKPTSEAIHGALNTNLCLSGADLKTSEHFSSISGRIRERQKKHYVDHQTEYREYNLINSNEVRTMEESEILIVSKNRHPVKTKVVPFYNNGSFKRASRVLPPVMESRPTKTVQLVSLV